jgi:sirohydrochlorin cobaltochelatase
VSVQSTTEKPSGTERNENVQNFSDSTLILIGHGSTLNADSSAPTHQHAEELRRRKLFGQVLTAFWKEEPAICAVLRAAYKPRVFCVPLFISEGYFTEEVIPRELGFAPNTRTRQLGPQTIHYCGPIGTHDSMTAVLLSRAREIVSKYPFPRAPKTSDTALVIAGHGTSANENSRKAIERQVELIRAQNIYAEVYAAFMEEEPRIGEIYSIAKAPNIVIVPFFISDGLHSYEDIPMLLGEPERLVRSRLAAGQPTWRNPTQRKQKLIWYAPSIGNEPHIPDVILERVHEAAGA